MDIGKKIKYRRLQLGLTMKQVADYVGVSEAAVSKWESGDVNNMRRDRIAGLAKILRVSPLYLIDEEYGLDGKENITDREILKEMIDDLSDEKVRALLSMLR